MNGLWKFLASVKLTVVLLLTLALTSIFGTLIPQNQDPGGYVQAFGEVMYRFMDVLDIFDMYHAWWFQLLMILLAVNIVVCSIDRFPTTWKVVRKTPGRIPVNRFKTQEMRKEYTDDRPVAALQEQYEPLVRKSFGRPMVETGDDGVLMYAEKWRWSRLGVYAVHLSVVLLLVGGVIGSMFGFEGWVNIPEGESRNVIRLRDGSGTLTLDFHIRCDNFDVSFYDNGAPKEFRSDLALLNDGGVIFTKSIIVNDPLRYQGVNIFQSSYGQMPSNTVVLGFTSKETGMEYREPAEIGSTITLPEEMGVFTLIDFQNQATFQGHDIGAAFLGELVDAEGKRERILLPVRFPSFDRMRKGNVAVSVVEAEDRFYTGLQVTRDPGVWVVYAGFTIMIVGCFITFFMGHQQICVSLSRRGDSTDVMVAAISNKNKFSMLRKAEAIVRKAGGPAASEYDNS